MVMRHTAKKLQRVAICELFTCMDGFKILALDYATSLNRFVLRYVIKTFLSQYSSFLATGIKMHI